MKTRNPKLSEISNTDLDECIRQTLNGDDLGVGMEALQAEKSNRQAQHTPTPWHVSQTGKCVMHSKPGTVLNVCEASIEDAAFIVEACNSYHGMKRALAAQQVLIDSSKKTHQELVKALKEALSYIGFDSKGAVQDQLRQAIAKAEGL